VDGLDVGEHLVLEDLEDSPVPLWELGWPEAPSRQVVAEILGPGLVSLAAHTRLAAHITSAGEPYL
jgi:hypothetical protein